jgi:hypothetical protein
MFFDELEKLEPGRVLIQGVNNYAASVCTFLFLPPFVQAFPVANTVRMGQGNT